MGLPRVPALPATSQEMERGLGNVMLIGSGLFLLPNMQTARGGRAGWAQPSPVKSCWRGLSAGCPPILPCLPKSQLLAGQGRAGQDPVVAVQGWDHGTGQTGSAVPGSSACPEEELMLRDREHLGAHEAQGVFHVFMAVPGWGAGGGSSCCDTNPIPVPRSCRHLPVPLSRSVLVCVPPWEVPGELPGPCPLLRESLAPSALLIPGFIQAVKAEPAPFSCPSPLLSGLLGDG